MKIKLLCVQKTNDKNLVELIAEYEKRLRHYVSFSLEYIELPKKFKKMDVKELKAAEGELILEKIDKSKVLVLLDDKGKSYDSLAFSKFIQSKMNASTKELVFCIGGAYGFSEKVYERANSELSLSKMTLTHQMVRLLFVEQLYRGFTILKGEKYHH